jgi:Protein of unknown function (DUF3551)
MRTLILSSALLAAVSIGGTQAAFAQATGGKAFCFRQEGGNLQCNYDTMAQCMEGREGRAGGGGCIANPGQGTTGMNPPAAPPPAGSPPPAGRPSTDQTR